MPREQRIGGDEGINLSECIAAQRVSLYRQPAALSIGARNPSWPTCSRRTGFSSSKYSMTTCCCRFSQPTRATLITCKGDKIEIMSNGYRDQGCRANESRRSDSCTIRATRPTRFIMAARRRVNGHDGSHEVGGVGARVAPRHKCQSQADAERAFGLMCVIIGV